MNSRDPQFLEDARVIDRDGVLIGRLAVIEEGEAGSAIVARTEDGREIFIPYDQIDLSASTSEEIVVNLQAASLDVLTEEGRESEHVATLQLAEEEMNLSTQWVEKGRVIVRKRVETFPEEQTIDLEREDVEVRRIPINEIVSELPRTRTKGETTIIPVVEEILVVEKRYRLVEEVHVTSTRASERHSIREELRREVVDVEEAREDETAR